MTEEQREEFDLLPGTEDRVPTPRRDDANRVTDPLHGDAGVTGITHRLVVLRSRDRHTW
jgi:hypothetical protein